MTTTSHASRPTGARPPAGPGRPPTHLRLVHSAPAGALRHEPAAVVRGAARPSAPVRPRLRLTRRGRVVLRGLVLVILLALLTATALGMAHRADAADRPTGAVVVAHHVVLPGETLWGIATELAPHADPRDTVAAILEFNSLSSSAVSAGQDLAIPPALSRR